MGGGGPPELFKIVRYTVASKDVNGIPTFTSTTVYVNVSADNRIKIAEILGITEPSEKKQLLSGTVFLYPSPKSKAKKK